MSGVAMAGCLARSEPPRTDGGHRQAAHLSSRPKHAPTFGANNAPMTQSHAHLRPSSPRRLAARFLLTARAIAVSHILPLSLDHCPLLFAESLAAEQKRHAN
uniref:Uncharacterized protein n=1 Tax=Plectus sambesii TaxID=2011161 RepID=A0A914UUS4_9BILA